MAGLRPAAEALVASNSALELLRCRKVAAPAARGPKTDLVRELWNRFRPLVEALGVDPMFGFAVARVQDRRTGTSRSWCLASGDPKIACHPRCRL